MATVDYSNYLEMQNQWVTSLVRIARDSDPEYARELAEIIAETLYRMLYLTQSQSRISTLPAGLYAGAAPEPADTTPARKPALLNN